uniref:Uncharacterized protein n=1 Tax=Oryza rufipogon TaxID=4529 RepID=A0A0E0QUR9_ORYRU
MVRKPGAGVASNLLAMFLSPLGWLISKLTEAYYKKEIPMEEHGMSPEYGLSKSLSSCLIGMLPERDIVAGSPETAAPLYRECVHPRVPQMAVIGYSESATNIQTCEMLTKWVARLLDGAFRLPPVRRMEASTNMSLTIV